MDALERNWRLLHVEDPLRIAAYDMALASSPAATFDEPTRRLLAGLHFGLMSSVNGPETLEDSLGLLRRHPALVQELRELLPLLDDISEYLTYPLDEELGWTHRIPVSVHARHTMDDVLTAFGLLDVGGGFWRQTGVVRHDRTNCDLFFVTLEKSERDYSPSTLYKDYAISPSSSTGSLSPVPASSHQPDNGTSATANSADTFCSSCGPASDRTAAPCRYTFLGPADLESFRGERPISCVWRLRRSMPAGLFREAKVAAG